MAVFGMMTGEFFNNEEPAASSAGVGGGENATEALGVALKDLKLTQGEKGEELWRLKATWANMLEASGYITVESPQLVYFIPPDAKELHVTSEKGDVNQKTQILRFIGKVYASQGNSTLTGDLLIYNGTARVMVFPDGGAFHGDAVSGDAAKVLWRMRDQVIEGSGGVSVVIEKTPPVQNPGEE